MSQIKVDTITDELGTGSPSFPNGLNAADLTGALPALDGSALTGVGGGDPVLLGTVATTSGSSVTLSGLDLTEYTSLLIHHDAVSNDVTTNSYMHLNGYIIGRVSINGLSDFGIGSSLLYLFDGQFYGAYFASYSSGVNTTTSGATGKSGITRASTSITFTLTAGSFDAGSIKVYGVA
mgnify:CR=1 FL=1